VSSDSETIKALAKLLVHKGTPPFMLAANIAEPNYQTVRLWKDPSSICVETVCLDDETGRLMTFNYRYSLDQVLQRIEMQLGKNREVLWDRNREVAKLVRQLSPAAERHFVDLQQRIADGTVG